MGDAILLPLLIADHPSYGERNSENKVQHLDAEKKKKKKLTILSISSVPCISFINDRDSANLWFYCKLKYKSLTAH